MLGFFLASCCLSVEKYYDFKDKISSLKYTSNGAETVAFYTGMSRTVVVLTAVDKTKARVYVASPSQSELVETTDTSFDFRYGNSKIVIEFIDTTSVHFGYATIPAAVCMGEDITVVTQPEYQHKYTVSGSLIDKCFMYAVPSSKMAYKVDNNGLKGSMKLSVYHEHINDNLYASYGKDQAADVSFIGASSSPWILRFTSMANEKESGTLDFSLKGPIDELFNEIPLKSYEGPPKVYSKPPEAIVDKKWWIPVIQSFAPGFLIVSWLYTIVVLLKKQPVPEGQSIAEE